MLSEENKEPNTYKPNKIVGDFSSPKDKLRNHWKVIVALSVAVVVLLSIGVAGTIIYTRNNSNVLATVGDKQITKTDLDVAINKAASGDPKYIANKEMKTQILDDLVLDEIYVNAAKRLKITITDGKTQAEKNRLTKEAVIKRVIGESMGEYVRILYNKYNSDMLNGTIEQKLELKKQVEPIAKDLYAKLSSGKMTFTEAVNIVLTDKTIGIATYPGIMNEHGGIFGSKSNINYNFDFITNVSKMKVGEYKLFTMTLGLENDGKTPEGDAFIIAKINKIDKGEAMYLQQWIKDQKTKLNVKEFYEKII
ncbi:MAG: SurA N-terminal domain-containing protein [Candidatus Saccharibacteria bacterium]